MMKTYLVTGGAGFIGSNFIIYMLQNFEDIQLINLDKLTYAGNLENLQSVEDNPHYSFIQGDVCDEEVVSAIFEQNDIDYVVNFAAESHVDRSIDSPDVFLQTNVLGTLNLLNIARKKWEKAEGYPQGKKFLQVSTDEVYGSLGKSGFFRETTPLDPHSPYSASKASADLLVKAYYSTYQMPVNITRCSNNYGPFQHPEKLIPLMFTNLLAGKSLPVYGDGQNVRDWLYVEDHCKALVLVLHEGQIGQVYNIGGHNERTNLAIVKTIISFVQQHVNPSVSEELIEFVEDRKGHDRRYGIDPEKIYKELGWKPETTFEIGIEVTLDWYLNHQVWISRVVSGEYQDYYRKMYEKD